MQVSRFAILFLFGVLIPSLSSTGGLAQGFAAFGYNPETGNVTITIYGVVGVVGIEGPGIMDLAKTPLLGSKPADQFDANVLGFFNPSGLPECVFTVAGLKSHLPRPNPYVVAGYTPVGMNSVDVPVIQLTFIFSEPSGPAIVAPAAVAVLVTFRRRRAKGGNS